MQKEKKGFSIELFTKESVENYNVYFVNKDNKLMFCYIYDSFLDKTFKAKAVRNEEDVFDKNEGMKLAFERCVDKRYQYYNKIMTNLVMNMSTARDHDIKIEKKFCKFLQSTK